MSNFEHGDSERKRAITGFTVVHVVAGVLAGYIKMPLIVWITISVIFEVWENSSAGLSFFQNQDVTIGNTNILGGKKYIGDSPENSACDILANILGWYIGYKWREHNEGISIKESIFSLK